MRVEYFSSALENKKCWTCSHWGARRIIDVVRKEIKFEDGMGECLLDPNLNKREYFTVCDKWTLLGGVPRPQAYTSPAAEVKKDSPVYNPPKNNSNKNESSYTPSSYSSYGNKTAHGIEAVEQIESIFNFFAALLSYIVYAVCWILKISLPATNKELLREVAKRVGSVARLRDTLTEKEYLANMKEIEVLKKLAEQIPEDYDPSFLIAQKIVFGIVVFIIGVLVAASI